LFSTSRAPAAMDSLYTNAWDEDAVRSEPSPQPLALPASPPRRLSLTTADADGATVVGGWASEQTTWPVAEDDDVGGLASASIAAPWVLEADEPSSPPAPHSPSPSSPRVFGGQSRSESPTDDEEDEYGDFGVTQLPPTLSARAGSVWPEDDAWSSAAVPNKEASVAASPQNTSWQASWHGSPEVAEASPPPEVSAEDAWSQQPPSIRPASNAQLVRLVDLV
jgi:hypothetical protein